MNLNISLDELITNIVSYGYQDCEEHEIRVTVSDRGGSLMVVLEEDGIAFNPFTSAPEPDLDASIEERRIGGLGVYFVKTLMDEATYERVGNRNRITLIQRPRSEGDSRLSGRRSVNQDTAGKRRDRGVDFRPIHAKSAAGRRPAARNRP